MDYQVRIEINGAMVHAGSIINGQFIYDSQYADSPSAAPVSISLPIQNTPFTEEQTKRYFDGLLPEGFSRKCVAEWMHVSESDYLSILAGLGRECIGAIQIIGDEPVQKSEYKKLSLEEVRSLAAEGATRSARLVTESHLSLTGASGKVGLYYDRNADAWYQPLGTAPSTHIVKQSHVRLRAIVINELLCMKTAEKCGISVPECLLIDTGGTDDGSILFASKRYDREFSGECVSCCDLPVPKRLHQEDFAQIMGLDSSEKYEHDGCSYISGMFDVLKKYSAAPLEDRIRLWDILMYDLLIGNTDNHLKNFSMVYSSLFTTPRLAPAYDMVSTTAYESGTRHLSLRIGGAETLDEISEQSLKYAAHQVGIGENMAMERFYGLQSKFENCLRETSLELTDRGFLQAEALCDRILKTGLYGKMI